MWEDIRKEIKKAALYSMAFIFGLSLALTILGVAVSAVPYLW